MQRATRALWATCGQVAESFCVPTCGAWESFCVPTCGAWESCGRRFVCGKKGRARDGSSGEWEQLAAERARRSGASVRNAAVAAVVVGAWLSAVLHFDQ